MDEQERIRANFAVETTLASRSLAARVIRLRRTGYIFRLIFIWAPSADYAVQRVADRVRMGGHDIPEETIRRRYQAGLKNFFHLYRPLADIWGVYDNTASQGFRKIAEGSRPTGESIEQAKLWDLIQERAAQDG